MSTSNRRFPAEWEKQQGILLCFPHNGNDWPGKFAAVQWDFVELNRLVARILELEARLARIEAELQMVREAAEVAVAETHRQYRRDLVPVPRAQFPVRVRRP